MMKLFSSMYYSFIFDMNASDLLLYFSRTHSKSKKTFIEFFGLA